jgi:hypothetical protein
MSYSGCPGGSKDVGRSVHVGPAQQFPIVVWLDQPGQVHDSVGPGERFLQRRLVGPVPDVHAAPLDVVVRGRVHLGFTAGDTNDLKICPSLQACLLEPLQQGRAHVASGSGDDNAHASPQRVQQGPVIRTITSVGSSMVESGTSMMLSE